jgi:hypothetical protein
MFIRKVKKKLPKNNFPVVVQGSNEHHIQQTCQKTDEMEKNN